MKKFFEKLFILIPFLTSATGMKTILGALSGALTSIVVLIPQFSGTAGAIERGAMVALALLAIVFTFFGLMHKLVKGELRAAVAQAKRGTKVKSNGGTNNVP